MKTGTTAIGSFIFFFFFFQAAAQDLSNKGKDFWVAYGGHFDGTTSRMALYITAEQHTTGAVTINGNTIPFTVTANQVTTVQLTNASTPSNALAYNAQVEGIGVKKGIHITAEKPVAVYAHILNAARSGSTLVLPTHVLGKEYYVASYKSSTPGTTRRSQFNVVATMDNTTVRIIPTQADATGLHPAHVPFLVTLSKGDVYQYQSDEDLTGTYIQSIGTNNATCQPIAVFSGSMFASLGCSTASSGDNLVQQLFPFAAWGKQYYTAPFTARDYDIFRILVQDPSEPVLVNGIALPPATLIAGRFYEINTQGNNTPRIITSQKPISVFQYLITQGCDGVQSDPEMIALNPIEQTLKDITVMSARRDLTPPLTNITSHYLNIIFKTIAYPSLRIDGAAPTAQPIPVPGTDYAYITQDVTASTLTNPAHRITADSGFICIAYGYGNVESYGYNAGANVKDLYQFVSIRNQYAAVDYPATCQGAPFQFSMTFPYQPTHIQWVFGADLNGRGLLDTALSAPAHDSTWMVNGKQLYRYRLPATYTVDRMGTFNIRVIAQNPTPDGCSGEQEINYDLQVYAPPVSRFNVSTTGCAGDSVRFSDQSQGNDRPIAQWLWNFGDNETSGLENPVHHYEAAGHYDISLSIITDIGCISPSLTQTVTLNRTPTASFRFAEPLCLGSTATFTDASSDATADIVKWIWNRGAGTADTIHTSNIPFTTVYTAEGSYQVRLVTQTDEGCFSRPFDTLLTVHPQPVAGFDMSANCLIDPFSQFTDTSKLAHGTIAAWAWDFGDPDATDANPNTSNEKNPVHKYTQAITYPVSLTVTSDEGCVATVIQPFTINGSRPLSRFYPEQANGYCSSDSVTIINNASVDVGKIVRLDIFWDDSHDPEKKQTELNPAYGKKYTFKYPEFHTPAYKLYTVRVVAYSGDNCFQETTSVIRIQATPEIRFDPLAALCGNIPAFTLEPPSVLNNTGGLGLFAGPGTSANGQFTTARAGAGTHLIRYTYTGTNGCTSFKEQSIEIYPVPSVSAGADLMILEGGTATLSGSGAGENITFLWTPNRWLNTVTSPAPITSTPEDITYTLAVTSAHGCRASDQVTVKVLKAPKIPNVFTPNGDGINDTWEIQYLGTYPGATVEIYNRYGQAVFKSNGYGQPWNGTFNGKPLPAGTYYYIVNPKNGRKQMAGFVDLIR